MFCQECDGKEKEDAETPREGLLKEYDPCLSAATESNATFSHELDSKDKKKFFKLLRDEKAYYLTVKTFVIRHHQDQSLNGKLCTVIDVVADKFLNTRAMVNLEDESGSKTMNIKLSNLVNAKANLDSLQSCKDGNHKFRKSTKPIDLSKVLSGDKVIKDYGYIDGTILALYRYISDFSNIF